MKERGLWTVKYEQDVIKVKNETSSVKLYINDEVQDVFYGMIGAPHLTGKLSNGKEVKAVVGGDFKMHCAIFVDNKLILED